MRLFIDSANAEIVQEALASGCVSGITTNPALVAKEPPHPAGYYGLLRDIVKNHQDASFSVQPAIEVLREGPREHVGVVKGSIQSRGLIIKIAASWENLPLIRTVAATGTPVNATCIFTIGQAIAAINAGARFVSVFWGRIKDGGQDPAAVVRGIKALGSKVEIIAGSIRDEATATAAFAAGADIVTTSLPVIKALASSKASNASAKEFEDKRAAWDASLVS